MVGKAKKPQCPGALHRLSCIWSNLNSLLCPPIATFPVPWGLSLLSSWQCEQSFWTDLCGDSLGLAWSHTMNFLTGLLNPGRYTFDIVYLSKRLPCWLSGKESTCHAGDPSSILRLGGFLGEGNGNSLRYSCLENPMDRGAWRATVHGVAKESDRT